MVFYIPAGCFHLVLLAKDEGSKATKVAQRPLDDGPPLTPQEIQLAPVIWAKLSGYSWWPARVSFIGK